MKPGSYIQKTIFICSLSAVLLLCSCIQRYREEETHFTVQGTVYVDGSPASDILVELGQGGKFGGDWMTVLKLTDEEGKYIFREKVTLALRRDTPYRIRVKNPFTLAWGDYRRGDIGVGMVFTENFEIASEE